MLRSMKWKMLSMPLLWLALSLLSASQVVLSLLSLMTCRCLARAVCDRRVDWQRRHGRGVPGRDARLPREDQSHRGDESPQHQPDFTVGGRKLPVDSDRVKAPQSRVRKSCPSRCSRWARFDNDRSSHVRPPRSRDRVRASSRKHLRGNRISAVFIAFRHRTCMRSGCRARPTPPHGPQNEWGH